MRIGCLQFAPQVGDVNNNLNRADSVLSRASPDDLDILILPELAFSGYNFKSLRDIAPFLEPSGAGITSLWARTTALKYNCIVAAGYPEKVDVASNWPTSPEYYNSLIMVNEDGETIANYRKTHLYYTDQRWALEGPSGFYKGQIPGLGRVAMGICMDINPWRFETSWDAFEFATHVVRVAANVVILSMAWLTQEDARTFSRTPKEPDMETLTYWVRRLEPIIRAENEDEIIVICANRTGMEDDAVYAGTSAVVGIQRGEVSVYGLLGRGEKDLLVVDTSLPPLAKLLYRPDVDDAPYPKMDENNTSLSKSHAAFSGDDNLFEELSWHSNDQPRPPIVISEPPPDTPRDGPRRIFGGHVFVTSDVLSPMTATFPITPFEESPLSPRYFWTPAEYASLDTYHDSPPTSSTRSNTEGSFIFGSDSPSECVTGQPRGNDVGSNQASQVPAGDCTPQCSGPESSTEFIELVKAFESASGRDGCPARPSSPKSRNASRTGRGERSDSVLAQRPSSAFGSVTRSNVEQTVHNMSGPAPAKSRSADTGDNRPLSPESRAVPHTIPRRPQSACVFHKYQSQSDVTFQPESYDIRRHHSTSPDLEKIGAEMMVFEEGPRPRRDSLECHPDDDDFVLVHASQIHHSLSRGRDVDGNTNGQSTSRNLSTSKQVGSPGLRDARSSSRGASSVSRPGYSEDSRAVSRGRTRTSRQPVNKSTPPKSDFRSLDDFSAVVTTKTYRDSPNLEKSLAISAAWLNSTKESMATTSPGHADVKSPGLPALVNQRTDINGTFDQGPLFLRSLQVKGTAHTASITKHQGWRHESNSLLARPATTTVPIRAMRPPSRDKYDSLSSIYSSSILTIRTSGPTTPKGAAPPTPKAMILMPGWDRDLHSGIAGPSNEVANVSVEHLALALDSGGRRPKSVVW